MLTRSIAAAVALTLTATPCIAASQSAALQPLGSHRAGASIGGYWRLPLHRSGTAIAKPQAGLAIASVQSYRDSRAPAGPIYRSDTIDLRLSGMAKPTLLIAGKPIAGLDGKARNNLGTGATVALVGGGVLLLVLLAAAASGAGDTCPTFEGSRDHCINP